jgi:hypothetical protein
MGQSLERHAKGFDQYVNVVVHDDKRQEVVCDPLTVPKGASDHTTLRGHEGTLPAG